MPTLPVFRAAGAKSNGTTGATTIAAPAGLATGDLEIMFGHTIVAATLSITTVGGSAWTLMAGTPFSLTGAGKLYCWWRIRQAGDSDPALTPSSDHVLGVRIAYQAGTFDPSNPIGEEAASNENVSDGTYSFAPGTTTPTDNCMVIGLGTSGLDSNTAQIPVMANTSLTSLLSLFNYQTTSGGGGGFGASQGVKATAGTTGTFTTTYTSASTKLLYSIVIHGLPDATWIPKIVVM